MIRKFLLPIVLLLFISGCSSSLVETAGKIVTPAHNPVPLAGKWVITQDVSTENSLFLAPQTLKGQTAQFSQDAAMLGDQVWPKPSYKVKTVSASDYVLSKYVSLPNNLIDYSKMVSIITVSTADSFVGEFIRLDPRLALGFMQDRTLYLEKLSDSVDPSFASIAKANTPEPDKPDKPSSSGILMGLRAPVTEGEKGSSPSAYTYRTLWLAVNQRQLHSVLEGEDIFFPRRSGFWKLKVSRTQEGNKVADQLMAYDASTLEPRKQPLTLDRLQWQNKDGILARTVDYIGNDYIAVENSGSGELKDSGQAWTDNRLMVLPVDHLTATSGIKLSDLVDKNGLSAFNKARSQALQSLARQDAFVLEAGEPEQNFGLMRKNGHWFLRGRLDGLRSGKPSHSDFSVNFLPPSNLVSFDTLYLSWQTVKDRVPDAIDAYTSPNRDLALLLTKSKLYIYRIKEGRLETEPLSQIALKQGESVVMAEWATGAYVENWEKNFKANGAKTL